MGLPPREGSRRPQYRMKWNRETIRRWAAIALGLAILAPAALAAAHSRDARPGQDAITAGSCFGREATISGTSHRDTLRGTPGRDVIVGRGGADRILGRGGSDRICGGAGADELRGGGGHDRCDGGAGRNRLAGCEVVPGRGGAGAANRPPSVGDLSLVTSEDAIATIDLLSAASDPDADRLAVAGLGAPVAGGAVRLLYGRPAAFDPAGAFDRLGPGERARADFGYTVADEHGTSAGATVLVTVDGVEDPPQAAGDVADLVEDDPATAIDVLANDTDVDGGPLRVESASQPGHGTVVAAPGGGSLSYEPDPDHCDEAVTDDFTYTLVGGSTASVAVLVHCVDDPPLAVDDSATLDEDSPATQIDVLANDANADGGALAIASATQPVYGTVTIAGDGSVLSYRPDPDYCDPEGDPDVFSYTLNGGSTADVAVLTECVNQIETEPALFPPFDSSVDDYIVRCGGQPLIVDVETKSGDTVSVDGGAHMSGAFQANVPLLANQAFEFVVDEGAEQHTHHVRCVPPDFPTWTYSQFEPSRHAFYLVSPTQQGGSPFAVIFDRHGTPVWWYREGPTLNDAKFLPGGRVVWWSKGATPSEDSHKVRELDGKLVRTFSTVTGPLVFHDFQETPNGNFLLISHQPRQHVDLTAYGGGADETVLDGVVEELSPTGQLIWSWSTVGHVSLDEPGRWWPTILAGNVPVRITHMNSVEPSGDGAMLFTLRSADAAYKVDKMTGQVLWKLGGTKTPQSLEILGDPHADMPLGGPHDVRQLADGTITVHDNRSALGQAPRAVRYEIDETARTATLLEQVTDPFVSISECCGSARRSADKSWLMSWGGRSLVTEFDPLGRRTFELGFGGFVASFRAVPAPGWLLDAAMLRSGMSSMFPR